MPWPYDHAGNHARGAQLAGGALAMAFPGLGLQLPLHDASLSFLVRNWVVRERETGP